MRLRPETAEVPADDLYQPFPGYTEEASPDQDDRREQLDQPAEQVERVEPEPDPDTDELPTDDDDPVPYPPERVEPGPLDQPERLPNDGQARTIVLGDTPTVILSDDPQRVSWCFYVHGDSAAGIRYALGRNARQDAEQDGHSAPLSAAEGTLRGTFHGTVAAVTDTPGTLATVVVLTERDTRR